MTGQLIDRMRTTGRGPLTQRLRLWTGLVLLSYVTMHYINHAAGNISLAAMETMLVWQNWIWAGWPGQVLLYGSLIVHIVLGFAKLLSLRSWHRPAWEWLQVALGLAIPWMLLSHVVFTRGAETLVGIEVTYAHELGLLWPDVWIRQSVLLLVVWIHAMVGIHFWLRIRRWYPAWLPTLSGIAVLVPILALTGWITAARRQFDALQLLAASSEEAAAAARVSAEQEQINRFILDALTGTETIVQNSALAVIAIVLVGMVTHWVYQRLKPRVRVTYGDGTMVTAPPGLSLLEISRSWAIPHMSVCGGRARCSTCRTLIVEGQENCTPPTEAEKSLLKKLNADANIRLACQCRIRGDVQVRPLIQPRSRIATPRNVDPLGWGVEREIAVLFLDIRGFSRISEKSLPYDVVFILNSLFGEVGAEIEAANGYIDKFMGDGLMAIFGLASSPGEASRDAIRAALAAEAAARHSSRMLTHHLSEPIRIGIGIDTGTAVIGRIGRTSDQVTPSRLTAIGDPVNIAARLEAATKELGATIVLSRRTIEAAGIGLTAEIGAQSAIKVHNITEPVDVVAITDFAGLWHELGMDAQMSSEAVTGSQGRRQAGRASIIANRVWARGKKMKKTQ